MKIIKSKILHFLVSFFLFASTAFASISFSINSDANSKTKILFLGFNKIPDNKNANDASSRETFDRNFIIERIKKDLATTDLFEVIVEEKQNPDIQKNPGINLAAKPVDIEVLPDFEKYSKDDIGAIVIAQFNYDQSGNLETRLRMWDTLDRKQLFGKFYTASKDNYRKMANTIADEIFKAITGEKFGHFNSKILYVAEGGSIFKRNKKINLIDFDGETVKSLTPNRDLVITPIFSKKIGEVFYVKYFDGHPQIFNLNLTNLRSQRIGGFRNSNFSPAINPNDPNKILLSAIIDNNSDIYELDIPSNVASRLTSHPAIDTTPNYSPDGKSIVFTSDRAAGQQIYIMDSSGTSVRRISSGSGSYAKPSYSPDGKLIAFTKIKGGEFFIGTMQIDGSQEKTLSSGYIVEGAKWSPSGRHILFSKQKTKFGQGSIPRLYIVDIVTGFEYEIPTPQNEGAVDPDWM